MHTGCEKFVCLRGGLVLPIEPCLLALELERRGVKLWRDGEDIVAVPASLLTAADKQGLKQWKHHLLALLEYQPSEVQ